MTNGDEVYYKRNESKEWHESGVVIGHDGKLILIFNRGIYIWVHTGCLVDDFNAEFDVK